MKSCVEKKMITVGARGSPLSKVQVAEVLEELRTHHPHIEFCPEWITTTGDKDLKTSLRTLEQTDFFTKEIDEKQLAEKFRITIHSAKDLPDPLRDGLTIVAFTKGKSPLDVLVVREGVQLDDLNKAVIATSSIRREEEIKKILPKARIVDIRGTIDARLKQLDDGTVDGVVMADAALIRLGYEARNRIPLSGPVAQFQGQLAVIARKDDAEMAALFSSIDARKHALYVGLCPPDYRGYRFTHVPLIETKLLGRPSIPQDCTHIIVTSKTTVGYLKNTLPKNKQYLSVGKETTKQLNAIGITEVLTCQNESQEGLIELIETVDCRRARFFWAHAKGARPNLKTYLARRSLPLIEYLLYDTLYKKPITQVDFDTIDAIYFSSPSTVDAFFTFFKELPEKEIITQGVVTKNHLTRRYPDATSRNITTASL